MLVRINNSHLNQVEKLMRPYLPIQGLDLSTWLEKPTNVCLKRFNDLSFFEEVAEKVYEGHYFFQSKGKQAVRISQEMLSYFITKFEPRIIKGLTPLEHLGARWLSRKLGFKSYGVVQTIVGPCELFILTKEDWENKINE